MYELVLVMLRIVFTITLFSLTSLAFARMYQWIDPDTGTTQLSGKPPVWYRANEAGPRVFVFEKGKIVDDTGRNVTSEEQERLRQQAFIRAEEDKAAAKEKLIQAKRLQATLEQKRSSEEESKEEESIEQIPEELVLDEPEVDEGPDVEDMRALIEQWEQLRKEDVRKLLDGDSAATPAEN